MKKNTMTDLVTELEKRPQTDLIKQIIEEAKAGEFHDFKNQKYVCGKVAANALLTQAGCLDLAAAIRNGDYDEDPDAEDIAYLKSICPPGMEKTLGLDK